MDNPQPPIPNQTPPAPAPSAPPSAPLSAAPPSAHDQFLAAVFHNLPVIVIHTTLDGLVLHMNPAAERITGYPALDLVGRNFWAVLFPGRLFAQVPRFMSAVDPLQQFSRDVPMTIRTRDKGERVIAWTRHPHHSQGPGGMASLLLMGVDLTDRLTNADLFSGSPAPLEAPSAVAFGNAGSIDGEFVSPLAISPPNTGSPAVAIAQVHEFLTEVATRVDALHDAYSRGELDELASIAANLQQGAHACGLLTFSTRAQQLHVAASSRSLADVTTLVKEIANLVRHGNPPA